MGQIESRSAHGASVEVCEGHLHGAGLRLKASSIIVTFSIPGKGKARMSHKRPFQFKVQFRLATPRLKTDLFLKNGQFLTFCFFRLFNTVHGKQMFNINFADDWIRTTDLWCQKQPLYQLNHSGLFAIQIKISNSRVTLLLNA